MQPGFSLHLLFSQYIYPGSSEIPSRPNSVPFLPQGIQLSNSMCTCYYTCTLRDGSRAHAMAAFGWQEGKPQVGFLRAPICVAEGRRNTAENEGTEEGQIGNTLGWVGNWKGTDLDTGDLGQRVGNFPFSQSRFVRRRDVAANQENQRGTEMGEEYQDWEVIEEDSYHQPLFTAGHP